MSDTINTKFVPSASVLAAVGLKVGDVRTDDAIYALIATNRKAQSLAENQISVAVYILAQRGHAFEDIANKTGYSVAQAKRFKVEGSAILRTGEVERTVSAIRTGVLSQAIVDEITIGTGTQDQKIEALETAGLAGHIKSKYQREDGKKIEALDFKAITAQARQTCEDSAVPATGQKMALMLPHLTEQLGLKVKSRESDSDGGTGPQSIEFHLKAALKDAKAIAGAADEAYVPTPHDLAALFTLCEYLEVPIMLDADVVAAVDALTY
jgi:hypothetical protein